jgi:hypothetical protein
MNTLGLVVFLGKLLIPQKLGVHASGRHELGSLGLFDAIGMGLVRVIVRTRVLLLSSSRRKEGECVRYKIGI